MLPGAYIPTEDSEVKVSAIERLRIAWPEFSQRVGAIEARYLSIGIDYHGLPLACRERAPQEKVQKCFESFVIQPADENQPDDRTPLFIQDLRDLRRCRDDAKAAMYRGDTKAAEYLIGTWRLDPFVNSLKILSDAIRDMTKARLPGDTPTDFEELLQILGMRRQWILRIPFIADSISMGFANEDQALDMALDEALVGDDGFNDPGNSPIGDNDESDNDESDYDESDHDESNHGESDHGESNESEDEG